MSKQISHIELKPSEGVIVQSAAQIYAAYIAAGKVSEGDHSSWMKKSVQEAVEIAKITDSIVIAHGEMDPAR